MTPVEVFKTTVKTADDAAKLHTALQNLLKKIKWNFDLEDAEKILRIETLNPKIISSVKLLLQREGFECEELSD
ncbi:hypothetical protein [Anditalea andensis]|uniref:Uncharacterized protein n=1 Tax=Anditalea andensis TaxID=1048983 RepID=A0A074L2P0_9BACT|nr:hypothetical protein [Anditalea andensis]KEO75459.1 hypothetical protein EL17_00985 [Anditalea andensis]